MKSKQDNAFNNIQPSETSAGLTEERICARVRQLREHRGMSRADFARAIGCDYSNYCRYENGARQFPYALLESVSDYCGVTVDFLFGRDPAHGAVLSDDEIRLIDYYRRARPSTREDAMTLLRIRAEQRQV